MERTPTERYIQSFIDVARNQLRKGRWREIEPALATSWEELREPDTPPWSEVADQVRSACARRVRSSNRAPP